MGIESSTISKFLAIFIPVLNLSFFIARRSFSRQRGGFSSFIIRLAIAATAISVAVMVLAVAFIQGFKYEIREKLFSFWGHVVVTNYSDNASEFNLTEPLTYDPHLVTQINGVAHVRQTSPFIVRPAIVKTKSDMEGIKLKGIAASYRLPSRLELKGRPIDFSDTGYSRQLLLSEATSDRLNVKAGDELQLYFIEKGNTVPRIRKVTVAGIFHTGMEEVDKSYAFCDLRMLQRINNWKADDINGYQVDLDDYRYMDGVADSIFQNYLDAPLHSYTMREVYVNIFDWLQLQNVNAQIVLIIMALVAIINLGAATMIIIVEQARMIGILKSMGMRKVVRIFLSHSLFIAGIGILLGNMLALGICFLQVKTGFLSLDESTYYMKQVPVRIDLGYIVLIDLATITCCVLFMWLPTLYIRYVQPVKVLQFK